MSKSIAIESQEFFFFLVFKFQTVINIYTLHHDDSKILIYIEDRDRN